VRGSIRERRICGSAPHPDPLPARAGRGSAGTFDCGLQGNGFVLPNSAKPYPGSCHRGSGGRQNGFVLPESAEPCGRDYGRPRIAAPRRHLDDLQCIECLDRRLAPRQRAALVAVEPHQARRDVILAETLGHDLRAHAAHPQHVDLRLGDADGGGMACGARVRAGDAPGQRDDLGRQRRVGEHRQAQAVTHGVARDRGLAGARARAGAARRVGAVCGADRRAGHAGPLSTS
jgi:hypothetical protein